jgi:hypothetical protein
MRQTAADFPRPEKRAGALPDAITAIAAQGDKP